MAKRFTDTDTWKKQWFMELTPAEKIAWFYIKDDCDCIGVWTPNFRLAEFVIGMQLDWEKFRNKCNDNIMILDNEKWWLKDFCYFQYGILKDSCNPHKTYIKKLTEAGLIEYVDVELSTSENKGYRKGTVRVLSTLQEQEQEEEQEKEQEEEKEQSPKRFKKPTIEEINKYCLERKNGIDPEYFYHYYEARDWRLKGGEKIKNWKSCIITFEKNDKKFNTNSPNHDTINDIDTTPKYSVNVK